jgi:hypothetical protein
MAVTPNYRFPLPRFDKRGWQDDYYNFARMVDAIFAKFVAINNVQGAWQNSTAYEEGVVVVDPDLGLMFRCAVTHTSPAAGTFGEARLANPSYWGSVTTSTTNRGPWLTDTEYFVGDFVTNGQQYAVCLVRHVSTVFATDVADEKWSVLLDLTGPLADAEASASAAEASALAADGSANAAANSAITAQNAKTDAENAQAAAEAAADALEARLNDLVNCRAAGGTANIITLSPDVPITAYKTNAVYIFIASATNTAATTANISGLGSKDIQINGAFLTGGEIVSGKTYGLRYDGTRFQLLPLEVRRETPVARSSDTQLAASDHGKAFIATGTFTQTFASASALDEGWWVDYRNDGTGTITLDPSGSQLIDGATTLVLRPGQSCRIICDGTAFKTIGLGANYLDKNENLADLPNKATARSNLGLGSLATKTTVATGDINNDAVTLSKMEHGTRGDILYYGASGAPTRLAAGAAGQVLFTNGSGANPSWGELPLPRGYGTGIQLSNNTSDATNDIDFSAGTVRDDSDTANLTLAATNVKQLDVEFAEYSTIGTPSGGRAAADNLTGAKWFYCWVIGGAGKNTQGFFSTSATPVLPTGFTWKAYRGRIYWSGSTIRAFVQVGRNRFDWVVEAADWDVINPGTSAVNRTVTAPPNTIARLSIGILNASSNNNPYRVWETSKADAVPAVSNADVFSSSSTPTSWNKVEKEVVVDASSQVRTRIAASGAADRITSRCLGFIDPEL